MLLFYHSYLKTYSHLACNSDDERDYVLMITLSSMRIVIVTYKDTYNGCVAALDGCSESVQSPQGNRTQIKGIILVAEGAH